MQRREKTMRTGERDDDERTHRHENNRTIFKQFIYQCVPSSSWCALEKCMAFANRTENCSKFLITPGNCISHSFMVRSGGPMLIVGERGRKRTCNAHRLVSGEERPKTRRGTATRDHKSSLLRSAMIDRHRNGRPIPNMMRRGSKSTFRRKATAGKSSWGAWAQRFSKFVATVESFRIIYLVDFQCFRISKSKSTTAHDHHDSTKKKNAIMFLKLQKHLYSIISMLVPYS